MGGDVNIEGININMIHVGHDEDMEAELTHAGMFADGTRAALTRGIAEKVTPHMESTIELHLNYISTIKKGK